MKRHGFIAIILVSLLIACTPKQPKFDPTNINDLQNLSAEETTTSNTASAITELRAKAVEEAAMGLGAQGGLAWASQQINRRLEKDKWYLETVYNFNGMMLSHGVLPPVLVEGNNTLNLADSSTIRISDKTYQIVQQARFATTPPNWRDYIWMTFNNTLPEPPNKVLLPRNSDEKKIWSKNIKIGWDKGIEQAYSMFHQNLARLKRDFNGMILYRKLLQENMVSAPYVSKTELGVTGDGSDMRINDQVLRITEMPKLQTDSNGWKAIVVKENDN